MYPEELVYPMKKQLTDQGFSELKSNEDVDNMVSNKGTTLVVVNSVCGCAAANARPGAINSLSNIKKPEHLTTREIWSNEDWDNDFMEITTTSIWRISHHFPSMIDEYL